MPASPKKPSSPMTLWGPLPRDPQVRVDEFRIEATKVGGEPRVWTRSTLSVASHIADQAVAKLGYERAEVRNTFGGDVSDPLYVATRSESVV